jgi:hypothetical protein
MPKTNCLLIVAFFMLILTAAAGAVAADNSTNPANSLLPDRSSTLQQGAVLHWLLTWPEKKSDDEEEDEKEEPLESDRPDFTESSSTVGFRRLQIESGYTYTQAIEGDPTHNAHDLPELLVRYGLAERLELRVAWDEGIVFDRSVDRKSGRVVADNGATDVEFGIKYALTKQDKWRPQTALIVAVSAPIGSRSQTSGEVDVRLNYCYSWELGKKLSLGCSTGNLCTAESADHLSQFFQSASIGYGLTEKLRCYNEWYVLLRSDFDDERPQHYYDAGLTYLVTPNFQLDWRAGVGLNAAADGFFTGCGFTVRR